LFFACAFEQVQYDFGSMEPSVHDEEDDRPQENIPASVVGDSDLENGDQIHEQLCLTCRLDSAPSFVSRISQVKDIEIERLIRDGNKGFLVGIEERSPPDGALCLNLTDQDIMDMIPKRDQEYGDYQP